MAIHQVTAVWTGFQGAPGYTNFHFMAGGGLISDAQQSADRVLAAIDNLPSLLPADVTIRIQPEVREIDEATGEVTNFHNITPGGLAQGTGTGGYSAASGAVVNWRTNDLRFGRRIRGRTFIVPLAGNSYDPDGTLQTAVITNLQAFADDLTGFDLDSEFVVWSRPRDGAGGVAASVTNYNVPDMAAVLRSRRD